MTIDRLPGIKDIAKPLVDALVREMDELRDRPESVGVDLRKSKDIIAVWFQTPMLSERDLGHLLGLHTDDVPPFSLFVTHGPVGVRVELLIRI